MRIRYSTRAVLGLVTLCAVGCIPLIRPSYLWASAIWSVTVFTLVFATLAAFTRRREARTYWAWLAAFGWCHMILALGPWLDDYTGEFIVSRVALDLLGGWLGHDVADLTSMPGIWRNLSWAQRGTNYIYLTYLVAGQSIFTLMIAFIGGLLGRWVYAAGVNSGAEEITR